LFSVSLSLAECSFSFVGSGEKKNFGTIIVRVTKRGNRSDQAWHRRTNQTV
jgi:hypothetical protein